MFGNLRFMIDGDVCSLPECPKPVKSKKLCGTHYERQRKHGDPSVVLKMGPKPGKTGALNPNWKGAQVGLEGQHQRVRAVRGTPKHCEHCNTTDPEKYYHWAFNNTGDRLNVWDYLRLCVTCHRKYDDEFAPRGSKHGSAKLTEEDIPKIFAMRKTGAVLREIAEAFGISITNASDILARKTWKHVQGGEM